MAEDKKQPPKPQPSKHVALTEKFRESNAKDGKIITVTPRVPIPNTPTPPRKK